jgi:hypothetical protein
MVTRIRPSTITNQPPLEIGSVSVISAGPTLNTMIAKPIAIAKAKIRAPRESSVSTSPSSPSSCCA